MFYKHTSHTITIVLIYVDDIILIGSHELIPSLQQQFAFKYLGDLTYFLGLQVRRLAGFLHLCQERYIRDLLNKAGMLDCKPATTDGNYRPTILL